MQKILVSKYFNSLLRLFSLFSKPFAFVENIFNDLLYFFVPLLVFLCLFLFLSLFLFLNLFNFFELFFALLVIFSCRYIDLIEVDCSSDGLTLKNDHVGDKSYTFFLNLVCHSFVQICSQVLLHVGSYILQQCYDNQIQKTKSNIFYKMLLRMRAGYLLNPCSSLDENRA